MSGHSIFGIYTSRQGVEEAVQALRDANFRSSDISVLAPENLGDIRDIGTVKSTKAPEGATTGGTSGAVVGGVLGWLVIFISSWCCDELSRSAEAGGSGMMRSVCRNSVY